MKETSGLTKNRAIRCKQSNKIFCNLHVCPCVAHLSGTETGGWWAATPGPCAPPRPPRTPPAGPRTSGSGTPPAAPPRRPGPPPSPADAGPGVGRRTTRQDFFGGVFCHGCLPPRLPGEIVGVKPGESSKHACGEGTDKVADLENQRVTNCPQDLCRKPSILLLHTNFRRHLHGDTFTSSEKTPNFFWN